MTFTSLYRKLQNFLYPAQGLVTVVLVLAIVVAIWAIFSNDPVKRTAVAAYFAFP